MKKRSVVSGGAGLVVIVLLALLPTASPISVSGSAAPAGRLADSAGLITASPGIDLGATGMQAVSFLVQLRNPARPACLEAWGRSAGLGVEWTDGQRWASIRGRVQAVDRSFGVSIHNFRTAAGTVVYASTGVARIPLGACGEVTGVGAIRSFEVPNTLDVPGGALTPAQLMTAYDASPLSTRGIDGRGQTVVFLEADGFNPSDLATFARSQHLSPFNVEVVGGNSGKGGETPMDLETVHEIAPAAKLVDINLTGKQFANMSDGAVLASAFAMADQRWKGAIMSVSLGFCESGGDFGQSDLEAMDAAVATAEKDGSTVFASSGDAGGLDCTPYDSAGKSPQSSFVGVVEPAALPEVTGVGGTALSTTSNGTWVDEHAWSEPLLSLGSGGGVSQLFKQPPWQTGTGTGGQLNPTNARQVPDVAADADPATGNLIYEGGSYGAGGGTSLATPIWAGFTALMDQYLVAQHHPPVGFFNPLLYGLANGSPRLAPFHDVTVGGNAGYPATPGYDMVTGLGSPDVWNLTQDLGAEGR